MALEDAVQLALLLRDTDSVSQPPRRIWPDIPHRLHARVRLYNDLHAGFQRTEWRLSRR